MLAELLAADVFVFVLVFTRLGAALVILPGIGEFTVSPRVRLIFAIGLALIVTPVVADGLPPAPATPLGLAVLLGGEVAIGVVIGTIARLLMSSLQIAGTFIAFHVGLGAGTLFDPTVNQQGAITGAFMTTLGIVLLFATNLHHLMLRALVDSYAMFGVGARLPVGDFADMAARTVSQSFRLGLQIAMPIIIVATVIYVAMGLMGRLMPQIQVFFIALPIQMLVGFMILALTLAAGMALFVGQFERGILALMGAG